MVKKNWNLQIKTILYYSITLQATIYITIEKRVNLKK
jgi:hypothetical protein